MDNKQGANGELRELALFAGAGGGILGGMLCGFRTVCAVELDAYCRAVLCARQNDGILPPFPIWDDVRSFDGRPWRGIVDVVSGGFPCADLSCAGKRAGIDGENTGLWREMCRVIGEVRPRYALLENVPPILANGGVRVLTALAEMGYDAQWGIVGADDAGAPHVRKRWWCVATDTSRIGSNERLSESKESWASGITLGRDDVAYAGRNGQNESELSGRPQAEMSESCDDGTSMADADSPRESQPQGSIENERGWVGDCGEHVSDAENGGNVRRHGKLETAEESDGEHRGGAGDGRGEWWAVEPDVGRVVDELAVTLDVTKAVAGGIL